MKPGMMDLAKWTEKVVLTVRHRCSKKQSPCIGIGLAFFDPLEDEEKQWSFTIDLAFDPHNPPPREDIERLERALEFISRGVAHIMGGSKEDINLEDLIVHGELH